jgi:hypothetical protein
MRQFKSGILPFLMSMAFALPSLPIHASAATITVGSVVGIKGGKIAVPVSLSGTGGTPVAAAQFTITYDPQILSYTTNSGQTVIEINSITPGKLVIGIISGSGIADGTLVNLVFDVSATASTPTTAVIPLTIESVYSPDITRVSVQAISGSITAVKAGDCDANGTTSIAEVQSSINAFLGLKSPSSCMDSDSNGSVSIAEVQKVINSFLGL